MAKVGAQRAGELTGKSKSTIQRAMNSGKLSFELDNNGRRVIDVSELERCFGLQNDSGASSAPAAASVQQELDKAQNLLEAERNKMRIRMLEEQLESANAQIEDLKAQRDQWQKQASQVLLTSQYSQKQAEDLAAQIKEREERARARREQMQQQQSKKQNLEGNVSKLQPHNENQQEDEKFNFNGLWKKVKGQ
ncbi:MAG: entry exclusion 1 domain-containing protein [Alphaproteobacteria bacterium]|nr:entry exclusion 1 domain-containing protein [Alphaproteobacteria bacterium]